MIPELFDEEAADNNTAYYNRLKMVPEIVKNTLHMDNNWLVGSGAEYILGKKGSLPRDWDIVINPEKWLDTLKCLKASNCSINTMGGIKYTDGDIQMDLWPDTLPQYFLRMPRTMKPSFPQYAVCLHTFMVVEASNFSYGVKS